MMQETGFLFDLDGVLIDSEKEYTRIWQRIDEEYITGVPDFAYVIKGTTLPDILDRYFAKDKHAEIAAKLTAMQDRMRFDYCPGAEELLHTLCRMNVKSAIVTSSDAKKMDLLRRQHPELWSLVSAVIDANMITHSKPHPEGYLKGAAALGLLPGRCVVVEDSILGMRAGKAAGALTIGLATTLRRSDIVGEPDLLLGSIGEIDVDTVMKMVEKRNAPGKKA